jgi:hypothetical protein
MLETLIVFVIVAMLSGYRRAFNWRTKDEQKRCYVNVRV